MNTTTRSPATAAARKRTLLPTARNTVRALNRRTSFRTKASSTESAFHWMFEEISTNRTYYIAHPRELFKFWLLGLSLRQLEHCLSRKICKSSLSGLFIKEFGKDYAKDMLFNIFSSVLREGNRRRDKDSIVNWCKKLTLEEMLTAIKDDTTRYRSAGQLNAIQHRQQITYSEDMQYDYQY